MYVKDKLLCNRDTCTSNMCSEHGYRGIDGVYVGVKLLYKHLKIGSGWSTKELPSIRLKGLAYHNF